MSVMQAKVIVNPVAGASTTYRKWPKISSLLRHIGLPFEFQYTEGVGHAIELAREATNNGCQLLVAVGGDGTVHEVANGILLSKDLNEATIGIISTGTGGDFIRSAGINRDYMKACSSLTGTRRRLIDVGVVEYQKEGHNGDQDHAAEDVLSHGLPLFKYFYYKRYIKMSHLYQSPAVDVKIIIKEYYCFLDTIPFVLSAKLYYINHNGLL